MTDQAQKELGKTLWNIADTLRGSMNADDRRDAPPRRRSSPRSRPTRRA
jgi:hypothetical protein